MRKSMLFLLAIVFASLNAYSQVSTWTPGGNLVAHNSVSKVNEDLFIYTGLHDRTIHLVWEELPAQYVHWYVVQQSSDGINFRALDSIQPVNLYDIHVNNYPQGINYDNTILYSTETGTGRFIYNDVLTTSEMLQHRLWYRVKIVTRAVDIYTKSMQKTINQTGSTFKQFDGSGFAPSNSNLPAQLLGAQSARLEKPGNSGQIARMGVCPDAQTPPVGYNFTGNKQTFYGTCCYWEEREYQLANITAPCGGANAWCCPIDCSPLAYDPCCVHICSEYSQCSCPPWTCCDVSNATIWIVYSSTPYTIGAAVQGVQDASCADYFDASVNVTTNSGLPLPVLYSWDNGVRTGSVLSQLEAGIYSLTAYDMNGCSETLNFTVNEPPALVTSFSNRDVTCSGLGDGSIDLSVSGGTPAYSYNWTKDNNPYSTDQDLTGAGPGNYAVTVTDANGCVSNQFTPIFAPDAFTGVITFLDLGCPIAGTAVLELCCYGTNTGSAVLSVTGGTPPASFIWSNGATTGTNANLPAGTYSVTAIDANGCSFETSATLGQPDEISLSSTTTSATCGQCNGTATINVAGGSGMFTYEWPSSAGSQTTATAVNLCAGSYTVIVSDVFAVNCFKVITVSVSSTGGETISATKTDVSCFSACDGAASVSFNCADAPCSVTWYDPFGAVLAQNVNSVDNLCAGDYSVVVSNNSGCISANTVSIDGPEEILDNLSVVGETCPGACDGIASAAPTGGVAPYSFQWQDSNGNPLAQSGTLVNGLCSGDYSLVITDASGCSSTFTFSVGSFNSLLATTITTQSLCFGDCNGSIEATPIGGVAPYSYQWYSNGAPLQGETDFSINGLCAGTYSAQITDANGCSYTTPDIFLNEPAQLTASVSATDLSCTSVCSGTAAVAASGGTGALTFKWYNGFAVEIAGETNASIANLCAGDYFAEVLDSNGCSSGLLPFTVTDVNPLTATLTASNVSCNGAGDGGIDLEVSGGFPPYTYSWNNGAFDTQDLSGVPAGDYTVVITDSSGCSITSTGTITEPDVLTAPISIKTFGQGGYHVSCQGNSDGQLTVTATGGTAPYTFVWSNGQFASTAIGLGLGSYSVTVTDANGCTAENSESLSLEPGPFTSDVTGVNLSCFGASDGSIDLTVTGGEPPFRYAWTFNGTADAYLIEDPTGVAAGTYTVNVVDTSLGCITRDTIVLTEPSEIVPVLTPSIYPGGVNISTMGGNDGSIDLSVSGGSSPYTYLWSNGATTEDVNTLTAGTYSCTITDSTGCQVVGSITLREPQPSVETIDTTICEGGSVFAGGDFQTTSGTYVDSFLNYFGLDSVIITNLTVLPASRTTVQVTICNGQSHFAGGADQTETGSYFDTLSAANGCDSIITTELTVIDAISLAFQTVDAGCDAVCDGSVSMTFTGGNPPFSILWSNGATDQNLSSLCAGDYEVTVTDADGCAAIGTATIAGGQPVDITVTGRNNSCVCTNLIASNDLCVINFADLPHGTLLGEQYAAQGVHITAEGFGAGSFNQLIVFNTYSTGTQDPDLEVDAGNIAIFPANMIDSNGDGLVDAPNDHSDGGKQVYTFDTPRDVISFKFIDKENPPGTATAYDAQGNVIVSVAIPFGGNGSVQTIQMNALRVSKLAIDYRYDSGGVTEIQLGCTYTCCDGQASAAASGGAAPYTYLWSNGATTADISNLCVGSYEVTVTDANGCSNTATVAISDFVEIEVDVTTQGLSPACTGNRMCALNFGDFPPGTILNEQYAAYGIHISGDAYQAFPDAVIIYNADGNGPDPDLETASGHLAIFPENLTDANNNTLVDVPNDQGRGGVMTFTFDYDRTVNSFVFVDKENGTAATAKAYDANNNLIVTVAIPDAGNGSIQTITMNATGVRKLVFNYRDSGGVTDIQLDCTPACCDGSATASATGGNPPYSYSWSNGQTSETATGLCPGEHSVTVTDADGCTSVQTATVDDCELSVNSLSITRSHFSGEVGTLVDGMTISLDTLCPFNIRAHLCVEPVGSVKFILNGDTYRVEEYIPYSMAGDNPTWDYHDWIGAPGTYTLDVIPYSGPRASGTPGQTYSTTFTVIGQPCGGAPKLNNTVEAFENSNDGEVYLNAYPNPFTDQVKISFNMPISEKVRLEVVAVDGRQVGVLFEGNINSSETYQVTFKAGELPDGMYFYRLITESGEIHNRKLLLFR